MLHLMPEIPFGTLALYGCNHARIEGITFRDANVYVIMPVACRDLQIRNIKQIGMWRYNTDGIHLKNCQDVNIADCFVRNFDDCLVINGFPQHRGYECGHLPMENAEIGHLPMENAEISHCVIWNDWDMAIRLGVVCYAPVIEHISIRDCDIIHASIAALNIDNHGHAMVRDIRFENIRIEVDDDTPRPVFQREHDQLYEDPSGGTHVPMLALIQVTKSFYARTEKFGQIQDILMKDITVTGGKKPRSIIRGHDAEYGVRNLVIENLRFDEIPVRDLEEARFEIGDFVEGVKIQP
jgi:polygalacturonase